MERRKFLESAWPLMAALPAAFSLGACANRPPAPPPAPPRPVAVLGLMPVLLELREGEPGFGTLTARPAADALYAPPPITPQLLGMAIGAALRNSEERDRMALVTAAGALRFDPAQALDLRLETVLAQRGVRTQRVDSDFARDWRAGHATALPAGVDGLLDVRVTEAGYESRSGWFTPRLLVEAYLRQAPKPGEEDGTTYYSDSRSRARDRRWFTTTSDLFLAKLHEMQARAPELRTGLQTLVNRMAEALADDVQQLVAGRLPPA